MARDLDSEPQGAPGDDFDENAALEAIVLGTASETGEQFFQALVRNLAEALGTAGAWVTEYFPDRRTLKPHSFWLRGGYIEGYEKPIDGTPCEVVVDGRRLVHLPDNVLDLYPEDDDFLRVGAVSYLGVPLLDSEEGVLGHLAVLHTEPLPPKPRALAIFRIFAARASAEPAPASRREGAPRSRRAAPSSGGRRDGRDHRDRRGLSRDAGQSSRRAGLSGAGRAFARHSSSSPVLQTELRKAHQALD